jgi:hypothetical protein
MKHTKKERLAMADALEAGLPFLWDGLPGRLRSQETWICSALAAASARVGNGKGGADARAEIRRRLAGAVTVLEWLNVRGFAQGAQFSHPAIQAYRRRWMLALIEEFRS